MSVSNSENCIMSVWDEWTARLGWCPGGNSPTLKTVGQTLRFDMVECMVCGVVYRLRRTP